jgi:hypothetical protein
VAVILLWRLASAVITQASRVSGEEPPPPGGDVAIRHVPQSQQEM